jgi:methylmalonyl-CoA mutase
LTLRAGRYVVAPPRHRIAVLDTSPLAADFPPPDRAAWLALVEKTLKGGRVEDLTSVSVEGLRTQALYTEAAAQPEAVRFAAEAGRDGERWDVRSRVEHPDPAAANAQALEDLEGGANSILLRVDPTGASGVAIAGAADMARAVAGVELELATVALDAGPLGVAAAGWLHAAARSAPRARLALHLDPLGVFARSGASGGPLAAHLADAARTAAGLRETYPAMTAFLASGAVAHEAGGGEALELAVATASALAYVRALDEVGVAPGDALRLIALGLAADAEYFVTLAKHRAARALWVRLASALGAPGTPVAIETRSSHRMLARLDPWTNLLRLTAAGFGAAAGGADAIVLEPFTAALGRPTAFARRQARNAQLVLMEESGLGRVADPAGGAWFLEDQTDRLARAAWALFQEIEAAGGLAEALKAGWVEAKVAAARAALEGEIASGARKLVGVTAWRATHAAQVAVEPLDPTPFAKPMPDFALPGAEDRCTPLAPWRMADAAEAEASEAARL